MKLLYIFILLSFILCNNKFYAQDVSEKFRLISNDTKLTDSIKEQQYLSLLKSHYTSRFFDTLFRDTFQLMRWYNKRGYCEKVIPLNQRNIFLMDSIGFEDKLFYRQNLYSLGYCLNKINKKAKAVKYYRKVLEYDIEDNFALYSSLNIGYFHKNQLEYYKAIEFFLNAIKIADEIEDIDYGTDASIEASVCYRIINTDDSVEKGIEILNKCIAKEKNNFNEETTNLEGYLTGLASLHRHLGSTYADKKKLEFEKALYNLKEALKYAHEIQDTSKSSRLADIYHDLGNLYGYQNHPKALKYFDTALAHNIDKTALYHLYDNKGTYYTRQPDFEKAKLNLHKALKVLSPSIKNDYEDEIKFEELIESDNKFSTITSLIHYSEIYLKEAETQKDSLELFHKVLAIIKKTDKLIDIVRLESTELQTKLFWRSLSSRIYTNATKACFALQNYGRAFYYMEKNKAVLLLEDVLLEGQKNISDIPEDILKTHENLKNELIKYNNVNDSLLQQKLVVKANYSNFIDTLDQKYQLYFKSAKPAEIITLSDVQKKIVKNKDAYVEYIIGENEGYGLAITQKNTKLFEIKDISSLKSQIKDLKILLASPIQSKEDKITYNQLSFSIYSLLFPKDVQALVKDKSLTIITDNILLEVPFEALQVSEEDNDFLIYQQQISYANSLTFLQQNKKLKRQNQNDAVGFAPIDFNNKYIPLQNSRKELKQLQMFDEANLFMGKEAVKNQFKNNLKGYKIVHLSTHAGLDNYNEPFLALRDSVLTLNELYLTKNSAELVVLSACETGQGELYNGEGVMSLSRGFFNTGAKSVVSSLWSIDDKATTEIMNSFYKNIKKGESKSQALHNAKVTYLNSRSLSETSPYYWASFVLIGDAGTLDLEQDYTLYYILGVILAILLLLFFLKKNKIFG